MLSDLLKIIGAIVGVCILVYLVVLFLSLIPALFGWALVSIVGLFTVVAPVTYWTYVGVGIGFMILINLIKVMS